MIMTLEQSKYYSIILFSIASLVLVACIKWKPKDKLDKALFIIWLFNYIFNGALVIKILME